MTEVLRDELRPAAKSECDSRVAIGDCSRLSYVAEEEPRACSESGYALSFLSFSKASITLAVTIACGSPVTRIRLSTISLRALGGVQLAMNQSVKTKSFSRPLPKVVYSIWYLLRPKLCLIRLMYVLCHSRTEQVCFSFFDFLDSLGFLDFLTLYPSCLQPASGAQPISFCNLEVLDAEEIEG